MRVNLRKLMQLIVFFAYEDTIKPLGKTKLFKLLYFTDITHIRTVGEPITGAEYLKYPYGPVPMQGNYVLKELRKYRLIRQEGRRITALQMPNMTIFTEQEIRTLHTVLEEYGKDTASVL